MTEADCEVPPLDSLDFNLEALFLWIKLTLTALSSAEKTILRFSSDFSFLVFLIKDFKFNSRFLLRVVLTLSFLTFLIADLSNGILIFVPGYGNIAASFTQVRMVGY